LASDAVDCGGGKSCSAGYVCRKTGGCATREELAGEKAAEEKRKLEEAERRKAELKAKKEAARQAELERQRIAAEKKQNAITKKLSEVAEKAAIAAEKQMLADQKAYFLRIMKDPNEPMVSRKLAAAILGKESPSMQMNQTERESAVTVLKNNIITSNQDRIVASGMAASGMSNDDLLAFMNDPSQNIIQRRIAALGLGKDPNSITSQRSVPKQGPSPAPNNPIKNQGIVLNPDVMKDIATLSPPSPTTPVPAPQQVVVVPTRDSSTFTPPAPPSFSIANRQETMQVLAHAEMARDAYENPNNRNFAPAGYERADLNWWDYFKQAGVSQSDVEKIEKSGFSATIYRKMGTKEVVIAFRGTELGDGPGVSRDLVRDVNTDLKTTLGLPTVQYDAAAKLTGLVQQTTGAPVVLTGHSLGGALASHAGKANNLKVITFNGARDPYSSGGRNSNQTNFITQRDAVGDRNAGIAGSMSGVGSLPGETVVVPNATGHGIDGIIAGLSDHARRR
jgi:hypothetical protein